MATRNMLKGNIEDLPPYKLLELRRHLEYIVEEEDSQPTPVFTATYRFDDPTALDSEPEPGKASARADGEFETPEDRGRKRRCEPRSTILSPPWREGAVAAAELSLRHVAKKAKPGDPGELMLSQLRFSQESIKGTFRNGCPVATMVKELREGTKRIEDIPTIEVVSYDDSFYSVGNRRLWAFKHCGLRPETRVPVNFRQVDDKFFRHFSTPTEGRSIRRRTDCGFVC